MLVTTDAFLRRRPSYNDSRYFPWFSKGYWKTSVPTNQSFPCEKCTNYNDFTLFTNSYLVCIHVGTEDGITEQETMGGNAISMTVAVTQLPQ